MEDITYKIENYINSQNENIWNELKSKFTFQLIYNPNEHSWMANSEDGIATIITPNRELEIHSFTHELLHIYLDFLGISTIDELLNGIIGEYSFQVMIEKSLLSYVYNFCCHKKMFPFYEKMGFSEYLFVQDRIQFSNYNLIEIKTLFIFNKMKAINQFIGQSLSLMNNVVSEDNIKCEKYLNSLKRYKPNLFKIIKDFDEEWNNSTDLDLAKTFFVFENKLNEWITAKIK